MDEAEFDLSGRTGEQVGQWPYKIVRRGGAGWSWSLIQSSDGKQIASGTTKFATKSELDDFLDALLSGELAGTPRLTARR